MTVAAHWCPPHCPLRVAVEPVEQSGSNLMPRARLVMGNGVHRAHSVFCAPRGGRNMHGALRCAALS